MSQGQRHVGGENVGSLINILNSLIFSIHLQFGKKNYEMILKFKLL